MSNPFRYLDRVEDVLHKDHEYVDKKDRQYGSSWKKRGGVGAFMMLARKWDRLEQFMERDFGYDLFAGIKRWIGPSQGVDGTVLAEIRDLRRYLTLVEAWAVDQRWVEDVEPKELWGVEGLDKGDFYMVMAWVWRCTRDEAKKRILEQVYGERPGFRAATPPAQAALPLAADPLHEPSELSPRAGNGGPGITPAPGAAHDLDEPLNAPNYALVDDEPEPVNTHLDPEYAKKLEEWVPPVVPHPSPVLELEHQRQPRDATNAEYQSFKDQPIPAGGMAGTKWLEIYEQSPAEDGRWKMFPIYHEEYGS